MPVPVPVVAIEISAPAPPTSGSLEALLRACNEAALGARCVDSESGPIERTPAAVAIVAWQSDVVARLEIGVRGEESTRWSMRTLQFNAADDQAERWRAVGFVIGTIVGEASSKNELAAAAPESEAAPAVEPPRPLPPSDISDSRPGTHRWAWGELDTIALPVSFSGPWLGGGQFRLAVGPGDWPVLPTSSASFAWQLVPVESIRTNWLSLSFGAALPLLSVEPPLFTELRLEALVRQQRFVSRLPSGERDAASRWIGGAQMGIELGWLVSDEIGLAAAVDVFVLGGQTEITQFGAQVEEMRISAFGGQVSLGSRYLW